MKARHRLNAMLTTLIELCLASCAEGGTAEPPRPGAESSSAPAELDDRSEQASYRVPVPQELAAWATYPIDRVEIEQDDRRIEIRYEFPRWLNGVGADIVLEAANAADSTSFDVTASELGSGTCTRAGARFECSEFLPGIAVDRGMARKHMLESNLAGGEIEQRLRVTDLFATDPIGVLEFELHSQE